MLEVLQIRALRREPLQVVVTAHLIGEYLPQLAWESTLGHAGDPLLLAAFVGGSRWGTDDPACRTPRRCAARRSERCNACDGDVAGYTAYLDRFHSRLGDASGGVCPEPRHRRPPGDRPDVGDRVPTRATSSRASPLAASAETSTPGCGWPCSTSSHRSSRCGTTRRSGISSACRRLRRSPTAWLLTWEKARPAVARRRQPVARCRAGEPGSGARGAARDVSAGVGRGRPPSGTRPAAA